MQGLYQGKESGAREFREKKKRCSKYVNIHLPMIIVFQLNNTCIFVSFTVRNMMVCDIDRTCLLKLTGLCRCHCK